MEGGRERDMREEGGSKGMVVMEGTRRGGRKRGWERARGGREEPMMLGRQRASVEEWRVEGGMVDEGNERGSDGTRHGRQEGRRRQFYLKSNKIVKAT